MTAADPRRFRFATARFSGFGYFDLASDEVETDLIVIATAWSTRP